MFTCATTGCRPMRLPGGARVLEGKRGTEGPVNEKGGRGGPTLVDP